MEAAAANARQGYLQQLQSEAAAATQQQALLKNLALQVRPRPTRWMAWLQRRSCATPH